MKRSVVVACAAIAVVALVVSACGSSSEDSKESEGTTTSVGGPAVAGSFGDLEGVCGPAPDGVTVSLPSEEAGLGTDKFYLGVANDRTFSAREGLLKEMYDASKAFEGWCNAAGGIAGVPIEVVDLDGQYSAVEAAMTKACTEVFALVGGGWAADDAMFSGKPESDFHKCKLIAVPGFAVSPAFSEANGQQQSLPNTTYTKPNTWLKDLQALYPENLADTAIVYGELTTIVATKDQMVATAATVPGLNFTQQISYPVFNPNLDVTVQSVKASGAKAIAFIGEPDNLSRLMLKLQQQQWDGIVFGETNNYDARAFSAGPGSAKGFVARSVIHPFEERAEWPATNQLLDILQQYGPADTKVAALSVLSFSAWLLFVTGVNGCVAETKGQVTRDCVLKHASAVETWTGGGLHATSQPSKDLAPSCSLLMQATAQDTWERLYPKPGSPEDEGGFSCSGENVTITGDLGHGNVDPSREI